MVIELARSCLGSSSRFVRTTGRHGEQGWGREDVTCNLLTSFDGDWGEAKIARVGKVTEALVTCGGVRGRGTGGTVRTDLLVRTG